MSPRDGGSGILPPGGFSQAPHPQRLRAPGAVALRVETIPAFFAGDDAEGRSFPGPAHPSPLREGLSRLAPVGVRAGRAASRPPQQRGRPDRPVRAGRAGPPGEGLRRPPPRFGLADGQGGAPLKRAEPRAPARARQSSRGLPAPAFAKIDAPAQRRSPARSLTPGELSRRALPSGRCCADYASAEARSASRNRRASRRSG